MDTIAILATLVLAATPPGSLVTVDASCTYKIGGTVPGTQSASGRLGVLSSACGTSPQPIFLQRYYRRARKADGSTVVVPERIANGRLVRFLKRTSDENYTVMEGVQLSDGRVLVNGNPVTRDE